ncbi:longitudinals lacking protein, isoforms A/B/D/L [Cephus cinctus]|uniref:Longitudinals lacking protein, isoforms A/B/D/L n=1 Tax=Cephus cinctus TaxID=211228 RepID=A0AAJ7BJ00_CEPCN|nr:longitudinals lacking protein, isoforms A/B/D/L [Cephus cinctus]
MKNQSEFLEVLPIPWLEDNELSMNAKMSLLRFPCPRCNKSYTTKSAVTAHYKYDCGKPPRFECPYCGKLSKKKFNVQDHIRHKHRAKPVVCNTLF